MSPTSPRVKGLVPVPADADLGGSSDWFLPPRGESWTAFLASSSSLAQTLLLHTLGERTSAWELRVINSWVSEQTNFFYTCEGLVPTGALLGGGRPEGRLAAGPSAHRQKAGCSRPGLGSTHLGSRAQAGILRRDQAKGASPYQTCTSRTVTEPLLFIS